MIGYTSEQLERYRVRKNRHRIQKTYGLTPVAHDHLLQKQRGVCAICGQPETRKWRHITRALSIDHNHKTEKIRGLLCGRCNAVLGNCNDDISLLRAFIRYLRKHS